MKKKHQSSINCDNSKDYDRYSNNNQRPNEKYLSNIQNFNISEYIIPSNFMSDSQNNLNKLKQLSYPLSNIFPFKEEKTPGNARILSHLIDFYSINKKYLKILYSNSDIDPNQMTSPYSSFSDITGELEYLEKGTNLSNIVFPRIYVLIYKGKDTKKFVIKRTCIGFNDLENQQDSSKLDIAEEIIQQTFNEYCFMKLFSPCPNSVNPLAFTILKLSKINYICTELLMEHGGNLISEIFPIKDSNLLNELFSQINNALNYLESYKLCNNDIKDGNILYNISTENQIIIKLIDFDIAFNESFTIKPGKGKNVQGLTMNYVSPEVLTQFKNNIRNKNNNFDPWMSQMYSFGILMLQSMGFFNYCNDITDIDQFKESPEKYNSFMLLVDNFASSLSNDFFQKIIKLIKISISYHPDFRLSANEMKIIQTNLSQKSIEMIDKEYNEIINIRKAKSENNNNVQFLQSQLEIQNKKSKKKNLL